jgi:hypothetical protein
VHCACRYNNVFALQLIFARGVHVEQPDRNGSTPLHYASRYGHVDLCRQLIERGAHPARKNNAGQTPYDLAESHVVRQFLLPLQFSSERDAGPQRMQSADQQMAYGGAAPMATGYAPQRPVPSFPEHVAYNADGGGVYGQSSPPTAYQPPTYSQPAAPYQSQPIIQQQPSSGAKIIQPGIGRVSA